MTKPRSRLILAMLSLYGCGAELRAASSTRSSVAPSGGLTQPVIDEVIAKNVSAVRACYEKFAEVEGRPMGVVRLGWRVDPSGEVSSVVLVATTLHSTSIEACIAGEVGRWTFPSSPRETTVNEHPFVF